MTTSVESSKFCIYKMSYVLTTKKVIRTDNIPKHQINQNEILKSVQVTHRKAGQGK